MTLFSFWSKMPLFQHEDLKTEFPFVLSVCSLRGNEIYLYPPKNGFFPASVFTLLKMKSTRNTYSNKFLYIYFRAFQLHHRLSSKTTTDSYINPAWHAAKASIQTPQNSSQFPLFSPSQSILIRMICSVNDIGWHIDNWSIFLFVFCSHQHRLTLLRNWFLSLFIFSSLCKDAADDLKLNAGC